ncbi:sensor histidine kinase [Chitinophaga sp. Hz27]|uniref:PorY family sensor histidine kinase n=1 Tax=Chitinophaga sp. Hz27 TaxID=3347169 RepID=UPI0035D9E291
MKLLTRSTLIFLLIMLPIFAVGAFYLFTKFNKEIKHETDEELVNDKIQWLRYIDTISVNNPILQVQTPEFSLTPTTKDIQPKHKLKGIKLYQEPENAYAPFRQLTQVIDIHGQHYELTLRKSLIEKDDLLKNIIHVMLLAFGGLLFFVILSNFFISRNIWRPFYRSIDKLRGLQLSQMDSPQFPASDIHEFNQLNTVLNSMTTRIYQDYVSMKELTEDAAHEMQTPLAIVQSKLELLIQDDTLTEEQLKTIAQSSDELQRLSRLNHNLLLLAKIENHQFTTTALTDIAAVADKYLQLFEELIKEKQLHVDVSIGPAQWQLHPALADILISNLLGNAIKYNKEDGCINILLQEDKLVISNTSDFPEIPAATVFQRFKKNNQGYSNSNGLGLAISKKITDTCGLSLQYSYEDDQHIFTVTATR